MRKLGIAIALLFTVGYLWAQTGQPSGSSVGFGKNTGGTCDAPDATHIYFCASTQGTKGFLVSIFGAAYVDPFASTGTPSMSFSQITGQLAASQLPATTTCSASLSNVTLDGKGGGSATIVSSGCK